MFQNFCIVSSQGLSNITRTSGNLNNYRKIIALPSVRSINDLKYKYLSKFNMDCLITKLMFCYGLRQCLK